MKRRTRSADTSESRHLNSRMLVVRAIGLITAGPVLASDYTGSIRQGLKDDGLAVSISKLCRWAGVPRRAVARHGPECWPGILRNQGTASPGSAGDCISMPSAAMPTIAPATKAIKSSNPAQLLLGSVLSSGSLPTRHRD